MRKVPSQAFLTTMNTTQHEQPVTTILSATMKLTNLTTISKGVSNLKSLISTASLASTLNHSPTSKTWLNSLKTPLTAFSMPPTSAATEISQFVVTSVSGPIDRTMTRFKPASTASALYLASKLSTLKMAKFRISTLVKFPTSSQPVLHLSTNTSTTTVTSKRLLYATSESTMTGLTSAGLVVVSSVGGLAVVAAVGGIAHLIYRQIACNKLSPT